MSVNTSKFTTDYFAATKPSQKQIEQAKALLATETSSLKIYDTAIKKPYYHCLLDGSSDSCNLSDVRNVAKIAALKADVQYRERKYKDSLNTALGILSLGQKVQDNSNTIITYLVGIAIKQISLRQINLVLNSDGLKLSQDDKIFYANELAKYTDNETGHRNSLKGEYEFVAKQVDVISSGNASTFEKGSVEAGIVGQIKTTSNTSLWQPNNTKMLFYKSFMIELSNVDKPCGSTYESPEVIDANKISPVEGNFIGKVMYSVSQPAITGVNQKRCDIITLTKTAQTLISELR
jgi:hypothetical protein